jgi:hypothetical protein
MHNIYATVLVRSIIYIIVIIKSFRLLLLCIAFAFVHQYAQLCSGLLCALILTPTMSSRATTCISLPTLACPAPPRSINLAERGL